MSSARAERAAARAAAREKALADADAGENEAENEAEKANLTRAQAPRAEAAAAGEATKDARASSGAAVSSALPTAPRAPADDRVGEDQQGGDVLGDQEEDGQQDGQQEDGQQEDGQQEDVQQEGEQAPPEVLYWPDGKPMKKREMRVRAFVEEEISKLAVHQESVHFELLDDEVLLKPTFRERLLAARTMADAKKLLRELEWATHAILNIPEPSESLGRVDFYWRKLYKLDADHKRLEEQAMEMERVNYWINQHMDKKIVQLAYGPFAEDVTGLFLHNFERVFRELRRNASKIEALLDASTPWARTYLEKHLKFKIRHGTFKMENLEKSKARLDKLEQELPGDERIAERTRLAEQGPFNTFGI